MKKTLFAALALVSMASCSNEEIVEVAQKEAIGFENAFVNNSTRSVTDPTITIDGTNPLVDFAVYAHVEDAVLFNGVTVDKTTKNNDLKSSWKYDGTQYWIAGANYNFYAVAPVTNKKWSLVDNENKRTGVILSFENDGTQDVLFAKMAQMGKVSGNEYVKFEFDHILSKVKFSFENAYDATNATIKVKNIKITNAHKNGQVALGHSVKSWDEEKYTGTLELDFGMATDNEATVNVFENDEVEFGEGATYESQKELLLIPGAVTGGYIVTFDVELLVNGTLVKTYKHKATVDFTPLVGCSYDIKAIIDAKNIDPEHKQEAIEFTVTKINGWTPVTNLEGITTTVPNTQQ